jgi:ubiquitin carboxyl-terminal hydrolase 25/28
MWELVDDWKILGLTPSSYTPGITTILCTNAFLFKSRVELLTFAYLAQCRCDPAGTMGYFTALVHIVQTMQVMNEDTPVGLQNLILEERARNRFTRDDYLKAVSMLGFGH